MSEPLFTASEISRKLQEPHSKLVKALSDGRVKPDFKAGKIVLFRTDSVEKVRAGLTARKSEL